MKLYLEFTGRRRQTATRWTWPKTMVYRDSGKPIPDLKWHFTGSIVKQPDPEKDATRCTPPT